MDFSPFSCFSYHLLLLFVGVGAVYAAEGGFFSVDDFSVASFVDLAAAVGADFEAGLNGDGDEVGEAFEQACADFFSFLSKFENFLFFLAHGLNRVFH